MKKRSVFYFLLLLCLLPNTQAMLYAAQDISQWHLPEGAIARLGKGPANQIAFSPDGNYLAVVSDVGVWIYDALTGTEQALLARHSGNAFYNAVFSPDGHYLIVFGGGQKAQLWDIGTQTLKGTFDGYSQWPSDVAFSPDGYTLAIADTNQTTQLWDVSTMTLKSTLEGSTDAPGHEGMEYFRIAYSPNGETFAIGAEDGTIRLWDTSTGTLKHTLIGNITSVRNFSFNPDGSTIATWGFSETVWLWDAETGTHKYTIEHTYARRDINKSIAFSPDGSTIAILGMSGLLLFDIVTGERRYEFKHNTAMQYFAFSPDGKTLATAYAPENKVSKVLLWDTSSYKHKYTLENSDVVDSITFSSDGKTLTTASANNTVQTWNTRTGAHIYTIEHTGAVVGVMYSPDKRNILTTVHSDKTVRVWNTETRTPESSFRLTEHTKDISSAAFSPDGQKLATASQDNVLLWDISAWIFKEKLMKSNYSEGPSIGGFSPDGASLAVIEASSDVYLFWMSHERVNKRFKEVNALTRRKTELFKSVAYSPDGRTIAIQMDTGIVMCDAETAKIKYTFQPIEGNNRLEGVLYSPDGRTIATTSDGKVQLWNIQSQSLMCTLTEKWIGVPSAFSPDGNTIATKTKNDWKPTVRLWDSTTGILENTLTGHSNKINSVTYSQDGNTLVTASQDGTVLLWDLTSQQLNSNKED